MGLHLDPAAVVVLHMNTDATVRLVGDEEREKPVNLHVMQPTIAAATEGQFLLHPELYSVPETKTDSNLNSWELYFTNHKMDVRFGGDRRWRQFAVIHRARLTYR